MHKATTIAIMALCVATAHTAPTAFNDKWSSSESWASRLPFGLRADHDSTISVSRHRHPWSDTVHQQRSLSEPGFAGSFHDNQVANRIGVSAYYYMVVCTSSALCYGVAISLFCASLQVSRQRREGTPKAKKYLVALTCFMFLLNTGLFATNIGYCFTLFCWARDAVAQNTPTLNDRLLSVFNGATPYHVCQGIFETLNFLIGDGIIVWRSIVLWPDRRFVQGGLCCLFLGDIAVSLFFMCKSSAAVASGNSQNVTIWTTIDSARILVSLGVNLVATLCIGVKAWQFRSTLRHGFSMARTKTSLVNRLLTLLVECGLVFCVFQFIYAVYNLLVVPKGNSNSLTSPLNLSLAAMGPFFSLTAGIYPSIVIVVTAKQESVFGTQQVDQEPSRNLSTVQFASSPESTRDHGWSRSVVGSSEPKDSDVVSTSSTPTGGSHSSKRFGIV